MCCASDFALLFTSGGDCRYSCKASTQPWKSSREASLQSVVNITPPSIGKMLWSWEKNNVSSLLIERPRKAEEVKSLIKLYEVWDLLHKNEFPVSFSTDCTSGKVNPQTSISPYVRLSAVCTSQASLTLAFCLQPRADANSEMSQRAGLCVCLYTHTWYCIYNPYRKPWKSKQIQK